MKNLIKAMAVLAMGSAIAHAGDMKEVADEKDLKKIIEDQGIYVETAKKGIVLSGYVDTSYTYQFAGNLQGVGASGQTTLRENGNNSALTSSEAQMRAFDTDNNDFNINAFKLALEKALPDENTWAAGFRADLMFGEDAQILAGSATVFDQASYLFLEQAYAQFRVPVGNGLDFKIGKFVTLIGYEVIESPANLNFSRGLLFQNAIPLTHTGILASYQWNDIIDTQLGLVNGWNTSDNSVASIDGFGQAVTGRIGINNPGGNASMAISGIYSADGEAAIAGPGTLENETLYVVDIWGQWAPKFANDRLLLAFNADWGGANNAQLDGLFGPTNGNQLPQTDNWWGVALYAKYQFTDIFSLAARGEYFHDNHGLKTFGTINSAVGSPVDAWSWTLTAGFDIWENLLLRLEYRYDLFNNGDFVNGNPLTGGTYQENYDQHQIALNVVYTF